MPDVVIRMVRQKTYGLESGKGFFVYDRPDLDGFHDTARRFPVLYPGAADHQVGERIWNAIKAGASTLVEEGQDRDDVFAAVRYGFPIEKENLLEELDRAIGKKEG